MAYKMRSNYKIVNNKHNKSYPLEIWHVFGSSKLDLCSANEEIISLWLNIIVGYLIIFSVNCLNTMQK